MYALTHVVQQVSEADAILQRTMDQVGGYKRLNEPTSVTTQPTELQQLYRAGATTAPLGGGGGGGASRSGGGGASVPSGMNAVDTDALKAFNRLKYSNLDDDL